MDEWLLFPDDPHIEAESCVYQAHGLHLEPVNSRSKRLGRMDKDGHAWTYMTPGTDLNVVDLLRTYWRLCEKVPARERAALHAARFDIPTCERRSMRPRYSGLR